MQFRRILCLLPVAMLPQFAQAAPPNAQTLGALQGVTDFCSTVDARDARAFASLERSLLQGLSEDQIEKDRRTAAYKSAYQAIQDVLKDFSPDQALAACEALVKPISHEERPSKPDSKRRE